MSNYHWLLTVKHSDGALDIAAVKEHAPDPGDLVRLDDGALATVITKSIFTDYGEEYQHATAIVEPKKITAWYEYRPVEEDFDDASS